MTENLNKLIQQRKELNKKIEQKQKELAQYLGQQLIQKYPLTTKKAIQEFIKQIEKKLDQPTLSESTIHRLNQCENTIYDILENHKLIQNETLAKAMFDLIKQIKSDLNFN